MPDNTGYQMFCCFHCHPQRYFMLHSTAWTSCIWSKTQSYPAKWYEGNSSKWICHCFFLKKCPFCKESQWKVNQKQQLLICCTHESCADSIKNIITNSDDQKLVYEYENIDFPTKEVCYHHKCRLEITYQVSKSKSQDTAILDDTYPTPTHFHTFKQMSLMNLNWNLLSFPFKGSFRTSAHTEI